MKILAVSEDTPYLAGGRLVFLKICRKLAERGHEITVITSQGATEEILGTSPIERRLKVSHLRIVGIALFILKLLWYGWREMGKHQVVLVNAGVTLPFVVVMAKLRFHRKPVVELHHDALSWRELTNLASTPSRKVTALIRYALIYWPLRFVNAILAVSTWTAKGLEAKYPRTPIYVIGNPVEA